MYLRLYGNNEAKRGDNLLTAFIRSTFVYLFLILVIRLLGKRQLAEMEPSEFVVSLLIADLSAAIMQDEETSVIISIIPIIVVLVLELILSLLTYHFIGIRKLLCGKPVILMEDGKILPRNMRATRVTPDELTEHLREKGITDLSTVKYAILETNGQISALVDPNDEPPTARQIGVDAQPLSLPVTIISNGTLIKDNLKIAGKTERWVQQILSGHNYTIKQTLLLTVDAAGQIYISANI